MSEHVHLDQLVEKLKKLPADKVSQVDDFVDFLCSRIDRELVASSSKLSESSFARVWDNDDDAAYDSL